MSQAESYAALFSRGGRRLALRRPVANQPALRAEEVRMRIRGATPEEIAGGISTTQRVAIILAADVPLEFAPVRVNDSIEVDGRYLKILNVDDQTHRDGDTLLAYVCTTAGA